MARSAGTAPHPLLEALDRVPVIGIIRGCPSDHLPAIADAVVTAGLQVIEVTLDSPEPFAGIRMLSRRFPGVIVGAGTVRSREGVLQAAEAGARYLVSPFLRDEVMEAAAECSLPTLPGASSPTEIQRALDLGAAAVKVFPARELGGAAYLKAIRGPLGDPPLIPTGGVDAANARSLLEAGALALGVGGSIFPSAALSAGDAARVGSLTATLLEAIA